MDNYFTYSIIIPHKNTITLLRRCIESIPKRNDIQIIVIDDYSDIISAEEWNQFQQVYSHVELYLPEEGKGAGYARNIGLKHAKGKWIIFADADDFFYENAFVEFDKLSNSEYDTIFFNCDSRDGKTMELIGDRMPIIRRSIDNKDYDSLKYKSLVPWGKMIKKDFIEDNDLSFEEIEVSNDVMFSLKLGMVINNVGIITSNLYCCTKNEESLFFKKNTDRMKVRIKAYKRANDYLYDNNLSSFHQPFPRKFISYFFPHHPGLFLWSIWKCRYKGGTIEYIKDICILTNRSLSYKIKKSLRL